jgi:hypothetical protein
MSSHLFWSLFLKSFRTILPRQKVFGIERCRVPRSTVFGTGGSLPNEVRSPKWQAREG